MDKLDPRHTVLLFFDMLKGHARKDEARYEPVIAAAGRLLQAARARRMTVAYANANHRPDNATTAHTLRDVDFGSRPVDPNRPQFNPLVTAGSRDAEVIDKIAPAPEDYLIPKYRWSAFFQTYLDLALRTRGIHTVILSGGSTEVGIASTAYSARDLDYNLVIVSDACTSPLADTHRHLMQHVFPRLARVRTTDEVLAMLARAEA